MLESDRVSEWGRDSRREREMDREVHRERVRLHLKCVLRQSDCVRRDVSNDLRSALGVSVGCSFLLRQTLNQSVAVSLQRPPYKNNCPVI